MSPLANYAEAFIPAVAAAIVLVAIYKSLGIVRFALFAIAVFAIEFPAGAIYLGRNDCVVLTGDGSCVAGPMWMIVFYQFLALPLIFGALLLVRRRGGQPPSS